MIRNKSKKPWRSNFFTNLYVHFLFSVRTSNLILTCIFSAGFLLDTMLCTSVACSQNSDVEELMFVSEPNALLTNQNFCFKRDYDGGDLG